MATFKRNRGQSSPEYTPIQIIASNSNEFSLGVKEFFNSFSAPFLLTVVILFTPSIILFGRPRESYRIFISAFAVLFWINSTFLYGNYGVLDGRGLNIDILSVLSIGQIIIWFSITWLFFVNERIRENIEGIVFIIIILVFINISFYLVAIAIESTTHSVVNVQQQPFHEELLSFSEELNVLHIIMDELQADITKALIDDELILKGTEVGELLDGFKFFENTTSVFPTTEMSVPAMLSGAVYKNNKSKEIYLNEILQQNNFFTNLEKARFRRDFHTIGFYCKKQRLLNCSPNNKLPSRFINLKLIDLSLFKIMPDVTKPFIYQNQKWFLQQHFADKATASSPQAIAVNLWKEFNENIKIGAKGFTYKLFHSMLTHSPYILNSDCQLKTEAAGRSLSSRKQQAQCGFLLTRTLLSKLKELGIYDNTFIVISSDHGSTYVEKSIGDNFVAVGINPRHYSFSRSTLLIKPFNSRGSLTVTNVPASLLDIPNTILASIGADPIEESGIDILSPKSNVKRTRDYYYYNWQDRYWREDRLPQIQKYSITGYVNSPRSWAQHVHSTVNPTDLSELLTCNKVINFGQKVDNSVILLEGFSGEEGWGRWSDGPEIAMHFKPDLQNCTPSEFVLSAQAFINEKNKSVKADVYLNESFIGHISFEYQMHENGVAQPRTIRLKIPMNSLIKNQKNTIRMHLTGINSPNYLGISDGIRMLGLGFIKFSMQ